MHDGIGESVLYRFTRTYKKVLEYNNMLQFLSQMIMCNCCCLASLDQHRQQKYLQSIIFQLLTAIDGISVGSGSTEGRTLIKITGRHFDDDVQVLVGGKKCDVMKSSITPSSLLCYTPKKPESWPTYFAGT